jgi:hypothetical protein
MTAHVVKLPKHVGKVQRWQAQCTECPGRLQYEPYWRGWAGRTVTPVKEEAAKHNAERHS